VASARRQSPSLDDAKGPCGSPTNARTAPGSTESATERPCEMPLFMTSTIARAAKSL
jgi:hypothetical protein